MDSRVLVLKQQSDTLKETLHSLQVKKDMYEEDLLKLNQKKDFYEKTNDIYTKINALFTATATASRQNAKAHFEKIITDALQFVTQNRDYSFVIEEMKGRQKASYEFYVKSTVNGVECKQKPEDANGGGFVDIIASAAKYAYLEIFNDPKIMSGTLLYDEPGKMISADMSVRYSEYLKFLGKHYGKQTIMITHNEALSNVADKTFIVSKNNNGVSVVKDASAISTIDFDDFGIKEVLKTNEDKN